MGRAESSAVLEVTGAAGSPPARGAWRTAWLLLAFMVVNFADKAVLGLAGPEIRAEFGITRQEFGTAQAAFFVLFPLSALAVGALTRRVRTSTLLLVLALLWSAAQLPMLWGAAGFGALVGTRVLLGAAEGPAAPVALHHVHGWFAQRERALPTAVLLMGAAVGVAVAAPVLGSVITLWGWRWSFGAVGLAGLLWAAVWTRGGSEGPMAPVSGRVTTDGAAAGRGRGAPGRTAADSETPGRTATGRRANGKAAADPGTPSRAAAREDHGRTDGPASTGSEPGPPPLRRILLSGTFVTTAFGAFAAYWWMSTLLTWAPDYLESVLGWDLHRAGTMVGAGAVANGLVLLGHGLIAQRSARRARPRRLPVGAGAGLLLTAAGCATAVYGTVDSVEVKVPLMMGPMALAMVMLTVAATACARITPPAQRGVVLGTLTCVYALGGVLSPLVLGTLVDRAATVREGYEHGWLLTSGLLVAAGLLAACFCRPEQDALRLGGRSTEPLALPVLP
ncbi:nitrate/nitrite transporter [Streptomyces sp. NPDC002004]